MKNSLYLVGDGDDHDVVADVERVFGIVISPSEAEAVLTVGQLRDLIEAKCANAGDTQACLSQVAFYRLRKALRLLGVDKPVTPKTSISTVRAACGGSVHQAWNELQRLSGLTLPPLETPFRRIGVRWSRLFYFVLILFFPGAFYVWDKVLGLPVPVLAVLLPVLLLVLSIAIASGLYLVFRDIPRRISTVGGLAVEAAGYSFSELAETKPACSPGNRWFALLAILRRNSGHKAAITRETTFFPR
jgi:hypothetical protein